MMILEDVDTLPTSNKFGPAGRPVGEGAPRPGSVHRSPT